MEITAKTLECLPPSKQRARGFSARRPGAVLSGLYRGPLPQLSCTTPDGPRGQRTRGAPHGQAGRTTRRPRPWAASARLQVVLGSAIPAVPQQLPLPGPLSRGRGGAWGGAGAGMDPRAAGGERCPAQPPIAPPHRDRNGRAYRRLGDLGAVRSKGELAY